MNCEGIELFLELSPKTKYWSLAQVWNREEKVCCSVCFSHRTPLKALFFSLQKKKKSRKEITYDPDGCFLDGCLADHVALCSCSSDVLISTCGSLAASN